MHPKVSNTEKRVFGSIPPHTHRHVTRNANVIYENRRVGREIKALALSAKSLHRSRGFESHTRHFLYSLFNVAHFCLEVLSEPRRVTLPLGNNLEMMSLHLAPRVAFITPDESFSRWPCVASRMALYDFISLLVIND